MPVPPPSTSLQHLPLRPSTLKLFQQRGFTTLQELQQAKAQGLSHLAAELGDIPPSQAANLFREVVECEQETAPPICTDLLSLLQSSTTAGAASQQNIVTFSREVDVLLNGGIALGSVTELCGAPGVGKTQLAMQVAVNTRLPVSAGGVAGECVYIDTEGSFAPERCNAMAVGLCQHVQKHQQDRKGTNLPEWFEPNSILKGIHYYRVLDEAQQSAVLTNLPFLLDRHKNVRLVVIDSMAFHIRAATTEFLQRTQWLTKQAAWLSQVAAQQQVAVLVVNQMTTKLSPDSSFSALVPALGEAWAHAVTTRLIVTSSGRERTLELVKSPRLPPGTARFQIVDSGIRGMEYHDRKRPREKSVV